MIHISIHQTDEDCEITIDGHAQYAEPGKDIVCSAISTLFDTLMSALQLSSSEVYEYENPSKVRIKRVDEWAGSSIDIFRIGVRGVEAQYPDYVSVSDW